jgi:hypothetical protein
MTTERMMLAIGRIERAVTRLETASQRVLADSSAQARALAAAQDHIATQSAELERLASMQTQPRQGDLGLVDPFSREKAMLALRSLDSLIDDLKRARQHG